MRCVGAALFLAPSFQLVDSLNSYCGLPLWYFSATLGTSYNPLANDAATPGGDPFDPMNPGVSSATTGGSGLPFAYDPLWRFYTLNSGNPQANGIPQPGGYYLNDNGAFEARFASGIGFLQTDPSGNGGPVPSAYGLQRLTNFNRPYTVNAAGQQVPVMSQSIFVPQIFVSPEDTVWNENLASNPLSPVLPDLTLSNALSGQVTIDWRYSWIFTGFMVNGTGGSSFTGNIVIFENRPFSIDPVANPPGPANAPVYQVGGETVVEAIWGHSGAINGGYAMGADRTVLLRWFASQADPVVHAGDWIADVTYERSLLVVQQRWWQGNATATGVSNPLSFNQTLGIPGEWDNLPPQRCYWYQVQKTTQAIDDPYTAGNGGPTMRSMVVYVDRTLISRTLLSNPGQPQYLNAALISPYVANVIPQQFTVRN